MASIHQTSSGKWELRWREGNRNRSRTYADRRQAQEAQFEVERLGYGPIPRHQVPTLRDFIPVWERTKDLAPSTTRGYAELVRTHIDPFLGYRKVSELTPPMLMEWQTSRIDAGAGPTALSKAQTLLGQVLDHAVLPWQYLDANPVRALPSPVRKRKQTRWLDARDVEAIRGWYLERGDLGSATLVSVLAYVGIRPQDALALTWDDLGDRLAVNKKNVNGVIEAGSKTGQNYRRRVFVPDTVKADLRGWQSQTSSGSDLIWPNRKGQPWSKGQYNNWRGRMEGKSFKKAAQEVGLGWDLTPYALRHTAASLFIAAGRTHTWVAAQLGHSPLVSLRTYQHLYADDPREGWGEDDYIREARGYAPRSEAVRI